MISSQFKQHHRALDARIVGYSATNASTGTLVTFDDAIVVCHSKASLRQWLLAQNIEISIEIHADSYAGLCNSLHEEGVKFLLDAQSLAAFQTAMAEDHRFIPATKHWTSELGSLIEPVFDMYRSGGHLLKDQLDSAIVGFCQESDLLDRFKTIPLSGTEAACRTQHVPVTWSEYREHVKWGFQFQPDAISEHRLTQMADGEQLCERMMKGEYWSEGPRQR